MTFRSFGACCLLVLLAGCAAGEEPTSEMMQPADEQAMAAGSEASGTVPAPEPAAVPAPSSFTVYFGQASWILNDAAEDEIDDAVKAAAQRGAATYAVAGYADSTGSTAQNMRLSKLRAEAVADALVARGIPQEEIDVSWHGAAQPAVETPPGTPEQANRRATIELR